MFNWKISVWRTKRGLRHDTQRVSLPTQSRKQSRQKPGVVMGSALMGLC
jgi:hypothetical protein